MSFERRSFAGGAVETTLSGGITSTALTIQITSATGWPTGSGGKFLVAINRGEADEEKVYITSRSGTDLTVASTSDRGVDGTTAQSHGAGATIEHVSGAVDFDEANNAVSQTVGAVTTKGDLLVATGSGALSRQGVGANSQILIADSAQATGVRWGVIPDGAIENPSMFGLDVVENSAIATSAVDSRVLGGNAVTTAKIADGAVTNAKIAAELAGSGLTGGAGSALAVNTDGSTLGVSGDVLAVANLGITSAHLAADSVTTAKIDDDAVTLAKIASEAWSSYTPTLGGTGWSQGSGSLFGRWVQIGRTVHVSIAFGFGGTSTAGSGQATITLPVQASAKTQRGVVTFTDSSESTVFGGYVSVASSATVMSLRCFHATEAGRIVAVTTNAPFTWALGDEFDLTLTYEAVA